jgi:hypothetical protein
MFTCNLRTDTCYHNVELVMDALTITDHDPLRTTGKIWPKSPPRTKSLPPNGIIALPGCSSERISHKVLSRASKQCLCVIGASSHIISVDIFMSLANIVPRLTLHTPISFKSKGILNLECDVWPLGSSKEATPDDATAKTIFFSDQRCAMIAFHKNVFQVPPWPQTKKSPGEMLPTREMIVL